jgi:hypothetical protein
LAPEFWVFFVMIIPPTSCLPSDPEENHSHSSVHLMD